MNLEKAFVSEESLPVQQVKSFFKKSVSCKHCGYPHDSVKCRFKEKVCNRCQKKGHLKQVCTAVASSSKSDAQKNGHKSLVYEKRKSVNAINDVNVLSDNEDKLLSVTTLHVVRDEIKVAINDQIVPFEVDSVHSSKVNKTDRTVQDLFDNYEVDPKKSIVGLVAKTHVKSDSVPKFRKHRTVPLQYKSMVEDALLTWVNDNIIQSDSSTEWAALIVTVMKSDNSLRICEHNIQINKKKSAVKVSSLEYLGCHVSGEGVRPSAKKVQAILDAPSPTSVAEFSHFLCAPLYDLLKKNANFKWSKTEQTAFATVKKDLAESPLLCNYDGETSLVVKVDASPTGVGGVLLQKVEWKEVPVYFVSKKLISAERNYVQIDREGLALDFVLNRFRYFLLGRKFEARTDHKPLLGLFGKGHQILHQANADIQRWALLLSQYDFDLVYKTGRMLRQVHLVDDSNPDKSQLESYTVNHWLSDVDSRISSGRTTDERAKINEALILVSSEHGDAHKTLNSMTFSKLNNYAEFKEIYLSLWEPVNKTDSLYNITRFLNPQYETIANLYSSVENAIDKITEDKENRHHHRR
ncbi:uncharacterized protein [Macrobrachium rosenbergii]|uniref:uncharacterized protein n=1 Tax=Macrobrachium rosenbergii TaxID=79674 RepID=UPI0034D7A295